MIRRIRRSRWTKYVAQLSLTAFLFQILTPVTGFALTSGPSQPEFSSYEPVGTTQMVDEFSGDFTYNLPVLEIPGPDGGGYSLSLAYHAGASPEEEASWVGYGWSLNPGAINRHMRGFPDDHLKADVTHYNRVPKNWTITARANVGNVEIFGLDLDQLGVGVSRSISYNNYRGFGISHSVNLNIAQGLVNLNYLQGNGSHSFDLSVNPAKLLHHPFSAFKEQENKVEVKNSNITLKEYARTKERQSLRSLYSGQFGIRHFEVQQRPTVLTPYKGGSVNFSASFQGNLSFLPIGAELGLSGSYAVQQNIPEITRKTMGYLYSHEDDPDRVMDYTMERETPYSKRDHYLSIPFSSADNFNVTGVGLGGGFRLHHKQVAAFEPNFTKSTVDITQVGTEFGFPTNPQAGLIFGFGLDLGLGNHTMQVQGYNDHDYGFEGEGDEPYFFRFNNDLGGQVGFGDDAAYRASFSNTFPVPGARSFEPVLDNNDVPESMDGEKRSGRSAYIAYAKNAEMLAGNDFNYGYTRDPDLLDNTFVDRSELPDQVGEITVTNADGNIYVYGLPVYSRNENQLRYLLDGTAAGEVDDNHMVYRVQTPETAKYLVGETRHEPYATAYLLTEIRTPDYLDRGDPGPSVEDFGGFVHFKYQRAFGGKTKKGSDDASWYKWRMPYNGLLYDRGELSEPMDDAGAVQLGEKEIYYLAEVETRTHIARFHTSDREDGLDAEHSEAIATSDRAARGQTAKRLQKLDQVTLHRKSMAHATLVRTVNFAYDYSAWPGVPNNTGLPSSDGTPNQGGKLTLRKVWMDYDDRVNAFVSPYEFHYQYPRTVSCAVPGGDYQVVDYPAPYDGMEDFGQFSSVCTDRINETPGYNSRNNDPWGNYQPDGVHQHEIFRPWTMQNRSTLQTQQFDPAAWQLKSVTLPTKGQVHVQYEEDEYQYVQDRNAMAMVSLEAEPNVSLPDLLNPGGIKYYLRVQEDLGIDLGSSAGQDLVDEMQRLIREQFIDRREKIYFKFLYSMLVGNSPDLENCMSEYVNGWAMVKNVGQDANGLFIELKYLASGHTHPRQVCVDLVQTSKNGKLDSRGDCNASASGIDHSADAETMVRQLLGKIGTTVTGASALCAHLNYELSYLKVPIPQAKRGGGLRVKRLLMYDEGIDGNTPVLLGSEYRFQTAEGQSSGVASNEPQAAREENPLVTVLDADNQNFISRIISGRDKKQLEGPIGENILPGASVGYSRVIVSNIHSGETAPGYAVNEYYTTKDYPFDKIYPDLDPFSAHHATTIGTPAFNDWMALPFGLVNVFITRLWKSQGYRFVQYEINGKPKRMATYAHGPDGVNAAANGLGLSSLQEYSYFEPGQTVPIMEDIDEINPNGWYPGREMEIVTEGRTVRDETVNGNVETDISVGITPLLVPVVYVTAVPKIDYDLHELHTHVTSKVVSYPAIVRSSVAVKDNIRHETEHLAFNPETGSPLLSRTTDGYADLVLEQGNGSAHDGSYHAYSIPGSREYPALGQKAMNERLKLYSDPAGNSTGLTITKAPDGSNGFQLDFLDAVTGTEPVPDVCSAIENLTAGDLVMLRSQSSGAAAGIYRLGDINGSTIPLLNSGLYAGSSSTGLMDLEILRSARTNELNTIVGSFTTYGEPGTPQTSSVNSQLLLDREALATALTALIANPAGGTELVDPCLFDATHSMDPAIRVIPNAANATLTIEVIDYHGAAAQVVCTDEIPFSGNGTIEVDAGSGELVYYSGDNPCFPRNLPCLRFCEYAGKKRSIANVVAASAMTLSDHWPYDPAIYGTVANAGNDYETGARGNWRPLSTFSYRDAIVGGADDAGNERIYANAGVFSLDLFDYKNLNANDPEKWLKASTVKLVSPNGAALEEENILGIYGSIRMGDFQTTPRLTAKNAKQDHVYFESFENVYGTAPNLSLEDGVSLANLSSIVNTTSHAGSQSFQTSLPVEMKAFTLNSELMEQGLSIQVWVRDPEHRENLLSGALRSNNISYALAFQWQAKTGEWDLYEAQVEPGTNWGGLQPGDVVTPEVGPTNCGICTVELDDLRYQPLDAEMQCFVYEPGTLRLLTTFDGQHFGVYNRYNGEGKLVRRVLETERGFITVQENNYHLPEQER